MSEYRLHPSQLDKSREFIIRTGQTAATTHLPLVPRRAATQQSGVGIIRITLLCSLFGALFWVYLFSSTAPEPIIQSFDAVIDIRNGLATVVQAATGKVIQLNSDEQLVAQMGDTIISETGTVTIDYAEGMSTELAPGTRVVIERLEEKQREKQIRLLIWAGRSLNTVRGEDATNALLEVKTPSSTALASNAQFTVDVQDDVEAFYLVHDGVIQVQMEKQEISIVSGEQMLARVGQSLHVELQVLANPTPVVRPTAVPVLQIASNLETASIDGTEDRAVEIEEMEEPLATYQVREGDTFWTIAAQHDLDVEKLAATNPQIEDVRFLQIGQEINIVQHSQ